MVVFGSRRIDGLLELAAKIIGAFEDASVLGIGHDLILDPFVTGLAGRGPGRHRVVGVEDRKGLVVILDIHPDRRADLAQVRDTGDLAGFLPRIREDRKKYRGEDRDYGDHNKQFDQRKSAAGHGSSFSTARHRTRRTKRNSLF